MEAVLDDLVQAASTIRGYVYVQRYYPTEVLRQGHRINLVKNDIPKWTIWVEGEKDLRDEEFESEEAAKQFAEGLIANGIGKKLVLLQD